MLWRSKCYLMHSATAASRLWQASGHIALGFSFLLGGWVGYNWRVEPTGFASVQLHPGTRVFLPQSVIVVHPPRCSWRHLLRKHGNSNHKPPSTHSNVLLFGRLRVHHSLRDRLALPGSSPVSIGSSRVPTSSISRPHGHALAAPPALAVHGGAGEHVSRSAGRVSLNHAIRRSHCREGFVRRVK